MTDKILYWTMGFFASLALILSIADMALVKGNQTLQAEVNQRQNMIATAQRVAPLSQQLSQALYDISVKDNDANIRELLVSQGFVLPEKAPVKAKASAAGKKDVKGEGEE